MEDGGVDVVYLDLKLIFKAPYCFFQFVSISVQKKPTLCLKPLLLILTPAPLCSPAGGYYQCCVSGGEAGKQLAI